jgi:hypothetical protein
MPSGKAAVIDRSLKGGWDDPNCARPTRAFRFFTCSRGYRLQENRLKYFVWRWNQSNLRMLKKAISEAAGESKPEAYPQGYVEDFDEPTCLREAASAKAGNEAGGLFQHPT